MTYTLKSPTPALFDFFPPPFTASILRPALHLCYFLCSLNPDFVNCTVNSFQHFSKPGCKLSLRVLITSPVYHESSLLIQSQLPPVFQEEPRVPQTTIILSYVIIGLAHVHYYTEHQHHDVRKLLCLTHPVLPVLLPLQELGPARVEHRKVWRENFIYIYLCVVYLYVCVYIYIVCVCYI